eukprot:m.1044573 g.1044573  ORF g.1044573 m.1044573 type:complete len:86 (+) comp24170_c0_seq17:3099-3356(+)
MMCTDDWLLLQVETDLSRRVQDWEDRIRPALEYCWRCGCSSLVLTTLFWMPHIAVYFVPGLVTQPMDALPVQMIVCDVHTTCTEL